MINRFTIVLIAIKLSVSIIAIVISIISDVNIFAKIIMAIVGIVWMFSGLREWYRIG